MVLDWRSNVSPSSETKCLSAVWELPLSSIIQSQLRGHRLAWDQTVSCLVSLHANGRNTLCVSSAFGCLMIWLQWGCLPESPTFDLRSLLEPSRRRKGIFAFLSEASVRSTLGDSQLGREESIRDHYNHLNIFYN